jgi:hypothetical protein
MCWEVQCLCLPITDLLLITLLVGLTIAFYILDFALMEWVILVLLVVNFDGSVTNCYTFYFWHSLVTTKNPLE